MKPYHQRVAIGIDFGGTAVKAGLVDETGKVLDRIQAATADINEIGRASCRERV